MGITDQLREKKRSKSRGATDVRRSLSGLGAERPEIRGEADWRNADFSWAMGIVIETTRRGGLVSFGTSRDKGAYMISILLDGDSRKIWISENDDLNVELEKITHFMASLPE